MDDDGLFLDALADALRRTTRLDVSCAAGMEQALGLIGAQPFDVALIDLHLKPGWGIDVLEPLFEKSRSCRAAILADLPDIASCRDAIWLGARDYAIKDVDGGGGRLAFLAAVTDFALGKRPTVSDSAPRTPASLARAEREYIQRVLRHVAGNHKRAAEVLGISRATLYRRLGEPFPAA